MSNADMDEFTAAIANKAVLAGDSEKKPAVMTKEPPWDMTPATPEQLAYLNNLLKDLTSFDWSTVDTTQARMHITALYERRKAVGIPFRPYD